MTKKTKTPSSALPDVRFRKLHEGVFASPSGQEKWNRMTEREKAAKMREWDKILSREDSLCPNCHSVLVCDLCGHVLGSE